MTLALIAGRGRLPAVVAGAQDVAPLVCGYEGMLPDALAVDLTFRLETLGTLLVQLGERGITQVCFCGGIDRPALDPTKLDSETMALVPLFQKALAAGDNGALQVLKDIFEQTGFTVVGGPAGCLVRDMARCADAPRCGTGRDGSGRACAAGYRSGLCDRGRTGAGC